MFITHQSTRVCGVRECRRVRGVLLWLDLGTEFPRRAGGTAVSSASKQQLWTAASCHFAGLVLHLCAGLNMILVERFYYFMGLWAAMFPGWHIWSLPVSPQRDTPHILWRNTFKLRVSNSLTRAGIKAAQFSCNLPAPWFWVFILE